MSTRIILSEQFTISVIALAVTVVQARSRVPWDSRS